MDGSYNLNEVQKRFLLVAADQDVPLPPGRIGVLAQADDDHRPGRPHWKGSHNTCEALARRGLLRPIYYTTFSGAYYEITRLGREVAATL